MDICRSEQKDKGKIPHSEGMGMKSSGNEEKSTPWSVSTDQVASPHSEGMDMELCWYAPFVDEILDGILVLVIHDDIVEPLFDELLFHGDRSPRLNRYQIYEDVYEDANYSSDAFIAEFECFKARPHPVKDYIPKARPFTPESDSSEEEHIPDSEETQPKTGLPHPIQETRPPEK